jgi:uncharacterized protein YkwD
MNVQAPNGNLIKRRVFKRLVRKCHLSFNAVQSTSTAKSSIAIAVSTTTNAFVSIPPTQTNSGPLSDYEDEDLSCTTDPTTATPSPPAVALPNSITTATTSTLVPLATTSSAVPTNPVTTTQVPTLPSTTKTTTSVQPATNTPTTPPSTDGSGLSREDQLTLDTHNSARSEVGVPLLEWNAKLASDALAWSQELARTSTFQHSKDRNGQGENLYMWTSPNSGENFGKQGTLAFIGEKKNYVSLEYPPVTMQNLMQIGHYTQVVWSTTRYVGCAKASGKSGTYLTCRYYPPGNYLNYKPY